MNRFNGSAPVGLYTVDTWVERDRASVIVYDATTGATVAEWWDDEVSELAEDGFLDPRDWEGSAISYCEHLGLIPA